MSRSPFIIGLDWTIRMLLAAVFIYAGASKIVAPLQLADNIDSYHILPRWGITLLSISLPTFEIIVGILILIPRCTRIGALAMFLMLGIFSLAVVSAIVRGLKIDCGCFGEASWMETSLPTAFVRDLVLLCLAAYLYAAHLVMRAKRVENGANHNPPSR